MYHRNTRELGATGVWKRLDKSQLFHPAADFYSATYRRARHRNTTVYRTRDESASLSPRLFYGVIKVQYSN